MFLKRLESVGFKSFAEPITVDFVPGVTAVVGPNGSGKSNITDAIRWVLGEQSAKSLRGTKMEDIIFQGSDTRKPLNFAEVTLILDNQDGTLPIDYQEVSVTRRVSRSGESEFFLNKQSCRLKDIVDLFLDSGLGREAFSIIGQGKIEEILSSKAEERRTIFEEAAGVLKYKNRKKKAEYKLAETQENLNRVEDIIHEIEGQLEPLKEQSSRAQEYLTQKDQLKGAEVTLLRTEIELLHNDWQEFLTKIEQLKEAENNYSVKIQVEAAEVEKVQTEIEQIDQVVESLQQNLLSLTESFEKLTGEKNVILERAKYTTENKDKLMRQLNSINEQMEVAHKQLTAEQAQLTSVTKKRQETTARLKQLERRLMHNGDELEQEIESLKADYIESLNHQAMTRHSIKTIEQQLAQITVQKERNQSQQTTEHDDYQQLLAVKEKLIDKSNGLNKNLATIQDKLKETESDQQQATMILKDMKEKLEQGHRQIDRLQSRKEMLEEMKQDFQGFYAGVKTVLKAREEGELDQIHGAVIELLDIPERYLIALETALATQAQHVVVGNEQAGRDAIALLKRKNNGRATFLPLDVIKPKNISAHYLNKVSTHPGFVTVANQAPKTDSAYQLVVDYLLGHTIIAENLKAANEIARLVDRRFRIVTLDGDIVNPGGSMTGGARKSTNQNFFTRDKELEKLTRKVTEFTERASQFEQEIDQQSKQVDQLNQKLIDLNEQRERIQQQLHQNLGEQQANQIQLSHLEKQLKIAEQDREQRTSEFKRLQLEKQTNETQLSELQSQIEMIQAKVTELTQEQADFEENKALLQAELQTLQVRSAEEKKEVLYQTEKVEQQQIRLTELTTSMNEVTQELTVIKEAEASLEFITELDQKIQNNETDKQEVTRDIQVKRQTRLSLTQQVSEREARHRSLQAKRQELTDQRQQLEVKSNRIDVELENRLLQLQEDYQISFEKAQQDYEKSDDLKSLKRKVKLIKRTIDELGNVNIGAIDEYERISERYQFLTTQQADLEDAKETLYTVIYEMDQEMEERFEASFSKIRTEFTEVFSQLFGGGHAELSLTDPDQLLTTGVEIKAQPPGKKAQQLALLSGGERALTAIALLFAILRVRPVPFCVLDEVEAALDEANVERFSRYLKTYSQDTQFIVITHRKGTMEGADVLYGVTMQESGVSRFVSVKLEETEQLLETKS